MDHLLSKERGKKELPVQFSQIERDVKVDP